MSEIVYIICFVSKLPSIWPDTEVNVNVEKVIIWIT